ncbi:MAG TPA: hypothetical protein VFT91_00250 [Dehalococcoidia bacterium]|nr:hypothetical protein [Dehalococcoidia bacterium]
MAVERQWNLLSSHGAVLFFIAANPDCTINGIAEGMALTQRTVWGTIGDLRRADMLHVRKKGRRQYYSVNLNAPFRHPVINHVSLNDVLRELVERSQRLAS